MERRPKNEKGQSISKFRGASSSIDREFYDKIKPKFKGEVIEYKFWKEVIEACNDQIVEETLNSTLGFDLPNRLGVWRVQKKRMKGAFILFMTRNGNKKRVESMNLNTFQYYYSFDWLPINNTRFAFKTFYNFKANRVPNRTIKAVIDKGGDYLNKVTLDNKAKW